MSANAIDTSEHSRFKLYNATDADQASVTQDEGQYHAGLARVV